MLRPLHTSAKLEALHARIRERLPFRREDHRLDRDIAAITVNRWGHGYSYAGSTLFDKEGDDEKIPAAARKRVGRIAFANADAAWDPYVHAAIDEARRAVDELAGKPKKAGKASG